MKLLYRGMLPRCALCGKMGADVVMPNRPPVHRGCAGERWARELRKTRRTEQRVRA
jgi:hypothetical protein